VKLRPIEIESAMNTLLKCGGKNGRPLSPKTVRHIGFLVHDALKHAVRWDMLNANPMDRVELPKAERREVSVLDETNVLRFFEGARKTRLYPFLVLAAGTGARRGELLALQWPDIDFETGVMTVNKSLEETKAGLRVKGTKSGKPRRFIVPAFALHALAEHRTEQGRDKQMFGSTYQGNQLVFCRPDGSYYKPDKVTARVTELARKLGFPKGVTLHVLRHSHASQLLSKGTPLPVVVSDLGTHRRT
jgi:integrase